jgi:hypothetical protein
MGLITTQQRQLRRNGTIVAHTRPLRLDTVNYLRPQSLHHSPSSLQSIISVSAPRNSSNIL